MLVLPTFLHAATNPYQDKIHYYAAKYGVNEKHLTETIRKESNFDPDVQSKFVDRKGLQEESYGLSQINVKWNPQVSIEEAKDPDFAINFMAYNFSIGKASMWSAWRELYGV